jgi:hypothetical protein
VLEGSEGEEEGGEGEGKEGEREEGNGGEGGERRVSVMRRPPSRDPTTVRHVHTWGVLWADVGGLHCMYIYMYV